jgi:hypothetical protein
MFRVYKVTIIVDNVYESSHGLRIVDLAPLGSELVTLGERSSKTVQVLYPSFFRKISSGSVNKYLTEQPKYRVDYGSPAQQWCCKVVSFYQDPGVFYTLDKTSGDLVTGTGMTYQNGLLEGSYNGTLAVVGTGILSRDFIDVFVTMNGTNLDLVVNVDKNITSLDEGIFGGLTGLTAVRFPADSVVNTISTRSFQVCSSFTDVVFPAGVTSIGDQSFQGCSTLTNIVVPAGVTSIGDQSFQGCSD